MTTDEDELLRRLRWAVVDYDGSQEADGAEPVRIPKCGELRQTIALIERQAAEIAALRAAAAPPREPTQAMQQAGLDAMFEREGGDLKRRELFLLVRKGWRAMYDAAPVAAPAPQQYQHGETGRVTAAGMSGDPRWAPIPRAAAPAPSDAECDAAIRDGWARDFLTFGPRAEVNDYERSAFSAGRASK